MQASFLERHSGIRDITGVILFVVAVLVGTLLINSFIFRSFSVKGPSMQETLHTGDRLIVSRLSSTWSSLKNQEYLPPRGQVIVFKNPHFNLEIDEDEYLVKRVIGLPGERVVLDKGIITVYNDEYPDGFEPDKLFDGPKSPSSGEIDTEVPEHTIFVAGDNRVGSNSYDSRNGIGTIPLHDVVGPVKLRVYPFHKIRTF